MKKSSSALAMLLLVLIAAATGTPAAAAEAELSEIYREWGEGPAQVLMLPADEKAWNQVSSDEEAEEYIRLFWARRDPTLGTEVNEFRREFEQRVAFADERWTTEETRGALSDRGRVFILLGPPRRIQSPGAGGASTGGDFGSSDSPFDTSGSVASGSGPIGRGGAQQRLGVASEERWIYEDDYVPEFVDRKRFSVRFLSEPGSEEVELRSGDAALGYMGAARRLAVVNPDLTAEDLGPAGGGSALDEGSLTVMAYTGQELSGDEGSLAALREALGSEAPSGDGGGFTAHLDAGPFQASDGRWIVPFQLSTEADPGTGPGTVVGEMVAEESGEPVLSFRLEQDWTEWQGQSYVKDTLVVPPGDYELRVGLEGEGGALAWAGVEEVEVPAESDDFWLSELLFSDRVYPMQEAQQMLEPFAWQGIVVVPRGDRTFVQGRVMWFYLHACNPAVGEGGEPALSVTVKIEGPTRFRDSLRTPPQRAGDHCWVISSGLDLDPGSFPAGDYEMDVLVRDTEAGKTLFSSGEFSVIPAAE